MNSNVKQPLRKRASFIDHPSHLHSRKTVASLFRVVIFLALSLSIFLIKNQIQYQGHASGSSLYPANVEFDPPSYAYGTYNQASLTNPNVAGVVVNFPWAAVEPQQGVFNFTPADQEIAAWVAAGKKVMFQIRFLFQGGHASCADATTPNDLPAWEVARIQHFCDSDMGMIIPDYFDPTFQADAKAYVSAIAQHYANSAFRNDIVYVRPAIGTGGETNLLMYCSSTANPACDYTTDAKQLIAYEYSPKAMLTYAKDMLSSYKTAFNYTTVVYGVTQPFPYGGTSIPGENLNVNPATGNQVEFDIAEWAASQGIGVGYMGLAPVSTFDSSVNFPGIVSYVQANYPNTYIHFQTVGTVSSVSDVQGDITNAENQNARTVEWYGQDIDNASYQGAMASWQQYVNTKFGGASPSPAISPTPAPSTKPGGQTLSLHIVGNQFVNTTGQAVRLIGVNVAAYYCYRGTSIFTGPIATSQTLSAMADWHINAVRITLNEDCWLGINGVNPSVSGNTYRNAIVNFVNMLHSYGMYAIVDLHLNAPRTYLSSAEQAMADAGHATSFWQSVASTFKNDPAVVFDAYNEPHILTSNAQTTNPWQCWKDGCTITALNQNGNNPVSGAPSWQAIGMQGLVNAIRSTGATNPILLGGLNWSSDLSNLLKYLPADPRNQLAASLHNYNVCNQSNQYCQKVLLPVAQKMPLVTSEFGEIDCTSSFVLPFMNWADAHGISYTAWNWWPAQTCGGFGLLADWNGTPSSYGQAFYDHYRSINPDTSGPSPTSTPSTLPTTTPTPVVQGEYDNFHRPNQQYWGTATSGQTWFGGAKR